MDLPYTLSLLLIVTLTVRVVMGNPSFKELVIQLTDASLRGNDEEIWQTRIAIGEHLRKEISTAGVRPVDLEFVADFSDCVGTVLLLYSMAIALAEHRGEPIGNLKLSLSLSIKERDPKLAMQLAGDISEENLDETERTTLSELKDELSLTQG